MRDAQAAAVHRPRIFGVGKPIGPLGVAQTIVFLASDKARYITGITVTMDGAQYPVVV